MRDDGDRGTRLPDFLDRTAPRRTREPIVRSQVVAWAFALAYGIAWGIAWRRVAPLSELGSPLPIVLIAIGPVAGIAWLGYHVARGAFTLRVQGFGAAIWIGAAIVANVLTPGLAPSVDVAGTITGSIDGGALSPAGTCHWGPGNDRVTQVTAELPSDTPNLGAGTVFVNLLSEGVSLRSGTDGTRTPLAIGPTSTAQDPAAGPRPADNRTGTITLHPDSAVVEGTLSWSCSAPPG